MARELQSMRILLYNPDNGVTRNFMPHLWMFLLKSLRYKLSHHARTKPSPEPDDLPINTLSIEDKLIEEQTLSQHKEIVLEALNVLTRRQQEAIQLKFFQNLKNEEIAKCMSISVPAVYNLVSKALIALKETLGKAYLLILIELIF
jgi:RNA polymerase sigma factor (sigma-70 family)